MGDRKPGKTCSSELDDDWIDEGTNCRAKSQASGPTGTDDAAADATVEKLDGTKGMLEFDIGTIDQSPFGHTPDGQRIVAFLRALNAKDEIVYGDTDGDRGGWDGQTLTINREFYGKGGPTITELVHEASHALWGRDHPRAKGVRQTAKEAADDEYRAEKNQLAIYAWLKNVKGYPADATLDQRLEQEARGTLRTAIGRREDEKRQAR
jgi:hypothetical protein